MTRKTVLVVGCHTGGFGVIRGLAGRGLHIVALSYDKADYAHVSRHVSERVVVPHPRLEADQFIDLLLRNGPRWEGALILDTDDNAATTLSQHRDTLSTFYKIATANWDVIKQFVLKAEAHKLAEQCGVPHPKNFLPRTANELDAVIGTVKYPCILKPVRGHEFFYRFRVKNFEINNADELSAKFKLCVDNGQEVMLQEVIPGPETDLYKMVTYVNSKGELSARFFWNKIRQHPPMFGVGRVGVSKPRNEEVEALAEKLLKHSRYRGLCSIELKKDSRDDQFKLMEANVRIPRNIMISIGSGVNFPLIMYKDLVENEQIKVMTYEENLYWIELWPDIYNMLFQRKKEHFTVREYVGPYLSKKKVFGDVDIRDMKPFAKLIHHMLSHLIGRLSSLMLRYARRSGERSSVTSQCSARPAPLS
jgi:predicted ATP-grasp superfamily ATP-dependent carboligase